MRYHKLSLLALLSFGTLYVPCNAARALAQEIPKTQQSKPTEADYYSLVSFEIPEGVELEATSFQMMPDGKLAVASRRGEVWLIDNPTASKVSANQFKRFAHGLHEPIGLALRQDSLIVTQRPDVSLLRDADGDGQADEFEVLGSGWHISGDYHEYAFGSKPDADGNIWVALCLTGSFGSDGLYRGWVVRVTPDGKTIPTCSGIRSPGGIGANAAGDMFYTDNQGPWNGTCALKHLAPGKFMGHPGGFKWYSEAEKYIGKRPDEPKDGSRFVVEADRIPEYEPPAILFPYKDMGQSAAGIACDLTGGKFGPFQGQLFVGDQTNSTVMRCYLEKVKGHYQGACFPFREGLDCGVVGLEIAADGSMFAGETNRGWGSRGTKPFAVQRLNWTGKTPFEVLEMKAVRGGFELVFTEPVDRDTAGDIKSYEMRAFTYIFQGAYGSPEVDESKPTIRSAKVSDDGLRVTLEIDGIQRGCIHHLQSKGVRSTRGLALLHSDAYYTLNYLVD